MKKTVFIIITAMLLAFCSCAEKEPAPEVFEEPEYISEWLFEPQSQYPLFLKDVFESGTEVYDRTDNTIENVTVLGDENEFFVTFEYMAREGKNKEFNDDCWLRIYGKKTDDGKYILEHRGGGYQGEMNLEKSNISVSDILEGREAGYDAALSELIENLEPMEVFDTKYSFPQNVGEIFEIMTGEDKSKLSRIEVFGGANEFFARYVYSSETNATEFLQIRVRINSDGFYTLIAEGSGPMDYGLEKTDITLEDIK